MTKPENPRAFPLSINDIGDAGYEGMTLRDYFAAKALPGLITVFASMDKAILRESAFENLAQFIAKEAGCIADAMLKEREEYNSRT